MKRIVSYILITISAVAFLFLLFSVFQSGYGYQFDSDELHHANLVYLYTHGAIPFKDVYNSFYTPLFEWLITPVFLLFGFSFTTIAFTRYVMILLLIIRMVAAWVIIKQVFSRRAAFFFLPLFLFDPYLVFSGMQIRPDNFMMTVYTLSLMTLVLGIRKKNSNLLLLTGVLAGSSILIFMKVLPLVAVTGLALAWHYISQKNIRPLIYLGIGLCIPFGLFALYGVVNGTLLEMYQELIVEPNAAYNVFRYPIYFGAFNRPDNIYFYGTMGRPLPWVYVWILPLIGSMGLYHIAHELLTKTNHSNVDVVRKILCITLPIQWIVMFLVPSVFIQHYLPLNWLFAMFAAVVIDDFLTVIKHHLCITGMCVCLLMGSYLALVQSSFICNLSRSGITSEGQGVTQLYEKRWSQIPPTEATFPNMLFRPALYPIPFGYFIGNVPESILNRLPSIPKVLETKNVQHVILDEYALSLLPYETRTYITDHYTRIPGDSELMIKK
jgi:hypothetical protein